MREWNNESIILQALSAEVIKTIRDIIAMNPLYRYERERDE